ncbi:MAG: chitobiase/beta-hexosaminidase C-terminal domain-containing protein [Spirochaetales bacterium]|nr:chitobiase/beta-hexosaminidase C-terminal domain-containing protein [Spirochaetales bacterium]
MGRRVIPFILGLVILLSTCDNLDLSAQLEESIQKSQGMDDTSVIFTFSAGTGGTITKPIDPTVNTFDNVSLDITAAPNRGYDFSEWTYTADSGTEVSIEDSSIAETKLSAVGGNAAITASFVQEENTLVITAGTGGSTSSNPAETATTHYNEKITATALPEEGYDFSRWNPTGAGSLEYIEDTDSSSSLASFYVYGGDVTLTALFARTPRTLTFVADPAEGGTIATSSPATAEDSESYPIEASTKPGYDFTGWTYVADDGVTVSFENVSDISTAVTVTGGNAALTANFQLKTYQLTLNAAAGGAVSPSGTTPVQYGIPQNITATPDSGYYFAGWVKTGGSDGFSIDDNSSVATTITLTEGNVTLLANFTNTPRNVSILKTPDEGGTTEPVGSFTAGDGMAHTISANANTGYEFSGWSVLTSNPMVTVDFASPSLATTSVTVSGGDTTINANFTLKEYVLTLSASMGGSVNLTGPTTVNHGEAKNIVATPDPSYKFTGWEKISGSGTSDIINPTAADTDVVLTAGNVTLQANFEAIPVIEDVTFDPPADQIYTDSTTVYLATATADVDEIRYTTVTDMSDPGSDYSSWEIYNDSTGIVLSIQDVTTTINAIAVKSGMMPSDRTSGWYTITGTCAAPMITPSNSTPAASHSVTLSTTTPGATIQYTLDGTTPTTSNGVLYESGIPVTITSNSTLKAIAYKTDWASSSVSEEEYTIAWSRTHGDAVDETIVSGVVAYEGNYFVSSSTSASAANSHITALNSDGTLNWSVAYDQPMASIGKNITLSVDTSGNPDGGIITCGRSYDSSYLDLFKFNTDGNIAWRKKLHTEDTYMTSRHPSYATIKPLSDGRYITSGSLLTDGQPTIEPLISLISNSGTVNYSYSLDLSSSNMLVTPGLDVVKSEGTDSGFVVCGNFDNYIYDDSDEEWKWVFLSFIASATLSNVEASGKSWKVATTDDDAKVYLFSVCAASDGTYIAAGTSNGVITANYYYNTVLMKVNPSLEGASALEWQRSLGFTTGMDEAFYDVIETPEGDFIAVGYAENQVTSDSFQDGWIVKFDSDGLVLWQKAYGGSSEDTLKSITPTGDGGYIVTGMTDSFTATRDIWTMKIDSEGNPTQSNTTDGYLGITTYANMGSTPLIFETTTYSFNNSYGIEHDSLTGTSTPTTWTTTSTQYE